MFPAGPLYFIRHGQTDWNAEGRFQGQKDVPLNALGRQQASLNGRHLASMIENGGADFNFVSSPLARTRETMELLRAAMGLDPLAYRTDKMLIELSFGDWEGHTLDELEKLFPEALERREKDKWNFIPPGEDAESYEILSWRISGWLESIDRPTVCVTHGGVMRSLIKLTGKAGPRFAASVNIRQDRIMKLYKGQITWTG